MNPILYLNNLFRNLSDYELTEIKNGAYVIVEDNGHLYRKYAEEGVMRFWCEHASELAVYDIDGHDEDENVFGNILMGTRPTGHTWFQWERSKCWSLEHLFDWFRFLCTKKNQGPYGVSGRTEHNAIVINKHITV